MVLKSLPIWFHRCLNSRWQVSLLMFTSGLIYPLAFAPFEIWGLSFLSVTILLLAITQGAILSPFKLAYIWGLGAFLAGASWVYVSIHEFGGAPAFGAVLLTLLFAGYLSLFKGLFGFACHKLIGLSQRSLFLLIAPLAWVISEYLQAIVFNGFPWLLFGYSQIDSPLASIATWFGIYGVSWFGVVLCCCLVFIVSPATRLLGYISAAAVSGLVLVAHIYQVNLVSNSIAANSSSIEVALIQPNVPQQNKWDRKYFNSIIDTLFKETEPHWGADLIVWPEGAVPAYAHQVTDILQDLSKRAKQHQSHLLVGIPEYQSETKQSFVSLLALGEKPQTYHKQVLVPFGEYVPMEQWLRGLIEFLDLPMSGFTPAVTTQSPMVFDKVSVIPAICYEIVYPGIIRELSLQVDKKQPQLIVTVSNDAWFGDSFGPYQHMQMARMRSLELGIPLVRATNDGITGMVNADGDVISQIPRYQQSSLSQTISLQNHLTLYRRWGNTGIFIILLMSCGFIGWSIFKRDKP